MKPSLIIVNGFSGTGKTVLVKRLSEELMIPSFSADYLKEIIIDSLGTVDEEGFKKYSELSFQLLYTIADEMLKKRGSVILETCFHNNETNIQAINRFSDSYNLLVKQVYLYAEKDTIWGRIQKRKPERHTRHMDLAMTYETFLTKVENLKYKPLSIKGELLEVESSDFDKIDYTKIKMFCINQIF